MGDLARHRGRTARYGTAAAQIPACDFPAVIDRALQEYSLPPSSCHNYAFDFSTRGTPTIIRPRSALSTLIQSPPNLDLIVPSHPYLVSPTSLLGAGQEKNGLSAPLYLLVAASPAAVEQGQRRFFAFAAALPALLWLSGCED